MKLDLIGKNVRLILCVKYSLLVEVCSLATVQKPEILLMDSVAVCHRNSGFYL